MLFPTLQHRTQKNTIARFQLGLLSPSPFPSNGDGNSDGYGWRLFGADRDGDGDGNAKWRQELGMEMET